MDVKLIDILVRELPKYGGWPDGVERLNQGHDGELEDYRKDGDSYFLGRRINAELSDDYREHGKFVSQCNADFVTREQYEATLADSKQAWDGEGLPPVGVEFEHSFHADGFSTWHWRRCTAVGKHGVLCVDEKDTELYLNDTNNRFRPIRSEADKKKEAAIFAIAELCRSSASNGHSAELIYDAIKSGKIAID